MPSTVLTVLFAAHLVAAVVWLGGLAMLALVVTPGVRRVLNTATTVKVPAQNPVDTLLTELERRFTPLANLSLVVLVATGMLQMSEDENYGGFLQLSNTWAWAMLFKHLALIGMAMIASYVALVILPESRRLRTLAAANRPDDKASHHLTRRRIRLVRLTLVCGLLRADL